MCQTWYLYYPRFTYRYVSLSLILCSPPTYSDFPAPGGQNTDWHSDHGTHIAAFWLHKDFQDRIVWLWQELAKHYRDNTWIAGYNPLNEPTDPSHTGVVQFYDRIYHAIRDIDPHHAIFLDGNTFASDFSHFGDYHKKWENTAYSIHDYSLFGFPQSPSFVGSEEQHKRMQRSYEKKREWMDERGLCVWNGEWGPVYARREYDGDKTDEINEVRYRVLKAQLCIYNKVSSIVLVLGAMKSIRSPQDRLSWAIWLYKDIGFQGMVYVPQETAYRTLFKDFLAKKHRLGEIYRDTFVSLILFTKLLHILAVDAWGADTSKVQHIYQPLIDHLTQEIPEEFRQLYPFPVWKMSDRVGRLARNILVAEYLVQEWAEHFRGKSEEEIDAIARSFKFENCLHREELNRILQENASLVATSN